MGICEYWLRAWAWILVWLLGADFGVGYGCKFWRGFLARIVAQVVQLGVRILGVDLSDFSRRRQTAEPCISWNPPKSTPKSSHHSGPQRKLLEEIERWSAHHGIWGQHLLGSSRARQGCRTWLLISSCPLPLLYPLLRILWAPPLKHPKQPKGKQKIDLHDQDPFRDFWQQSLPELHEILRCSAAVVVSSTFKKSLSQATPRLRVLSPIWYLSQRVSKWHFEYDSEAHLPSRKWLHMKSGHFMSDSLSDWKGKCHLWHHPIIFWVRFRNEDVGHAQPRTASHKYENIQIPEIVFPFWFRNPTGRNPTSRDFYLFPFEWQNASWQFMMLHDGFMTLRTEANTQARKRPRVSYKCRQVSQNVAKRKRTLWHLMTEPPFPTLGHPEFELKLTASASLWWQPWNPQKSQSQRNRCDFKLQVSDRRFCCKLCKKIARRAQNNRSIVNYWGAEKVAEFPSFQIVALSGR